MELTPPILDRFTSDLVQSKATTQENTNRQFKKNCTKCDKGGFFSWVADIHAALSKENLASVGCVRACLDRPVLWAQHPP